MTGIRWKLWEWASWIAYYLCPDKKALALIQAHGTIIARKVLDETKARKD